MRLTWLLIVQAAVTAATAVTLFVAPDAIPASFGLRLTPDAHLLCYFYGATELALTFGSLAAIRLSKGPSVSLTCTYFTVVHAAEGIAGGYAVAQGLPAKVMANVIAHLVIALLFSIAALRQPYRPNVNLWKE